MYNKLEEYNGWTNKPTWIANLMISDSQGEIEYWREQVNELIEEYEDEELTDPEVTSDIKWELTDRMKSYYEDLMYEDEPDQMLHKDLLHFAFAYIKWEEIAEHIIDDSIE